MNELTIDQIIEIVRKINFEISDCALDSEDESFEQDYVSVMIIPEPLNIFNSYITVSFPGDNIVWDSENDVLTEDAIRNAVYTELERMERNSYLMLLNAKKHRENEEN